MLISPVGFEVCLAFLKMGLLGKYEPYRLVIGYARFRWASCLRLQGGQRDIPISHSSVHPLIPRVHRSRATKFYTLAPNICASLVWNLRHVTLLTPRILRWFVDFLKIHAPLSWTILKTKAAGSSETSVTNYKSTRCYILENCSLHKTLCLKRFGVRFLH